MTPVRLEPAALRSRVKHSTTALPIDNHILYTLTQQHIYTRGSLSPSERVGVGGGIGWYEKIQMVP